MDDVDVEGDEGDEGRKERHRTQENWMMLMCKEERKETMEGKNHTGLRRIG